MIEQQIKTIANLWQEVCDEADFSPVERKLFAGREFLNSSAAPEPPDNHKALQDAFRAAHNTLLTSRAPDDDSAEAAQSAAWPGALLRDHRPWLMGR